MFTLKAYAHCTGLFRTKTEAQEWADKMIPELGLEPIELLLNDDHQKAILRSGLVSNIPAELPPVRMDS